MDVSWPLHLWREGDFALAYHPVDGLAFETPDRFAPEIAAAGGHAAWMAQLNADPRRWARRCINIRAVLAAATELIVADPAALLCDEPTCRCGAALRQRLAWLRGNEGERGGGGADDT